MLCQNQKAVYGNACFSAFIVGVSTLTDVQKVGNILLCKMAIFTKIADTFVVFHKCSSSRLCLDFSHPFIIYSFAMRGSSLKSPSQNRTCPIKAYGSSISHSPNKHCLDISWDTPRDVSLGYSHIFSMSASKFGLCASCFSITPVAHTYSTFANLRNSHKFHSTCNAPSVSHSTLLLCQLCFRAYASISIS